MLQKLPRTAEAKKVAADEKAESSKNLSEAALMLLIKYQNKFNNSSNTAANIWP